MVALTTAPLTSDELISGYNTVQRVAQRLREIEARRKESWTAGGKPAIDRMTPEQMTTWAQEMATLSGEAALLTEWIDEAHLDSEYPFRWVDTLAESCCDEVAKWMVERARLEIREKVKAFLGA